MIIKENPILFSTISWKFNDGPLPSNAVVYSVSPTSSILVLHAVDDNNLGSYTCSANDSTTGIISEDTAYITVSGIYHKVVNNWNPLTLIAFQLSG